MILAASRHFAANKSFRKKAAAVDETSAKSVNQWIVILTNSDYSLARLSVYSSSHLLSFVQWMWLTEIAAAVRVVSWLRKLTATAWQKDLSSVHSGVIEHCRCQERIIKVNAVVKNCKVQGYGDFPKQKDANSIPSISLHITNLGKVVPVCSYGPTVVVMNLWPCNDALETSCAIQFSYTRYTESTLRGIKTHQHFCVITSAVLHRFW